ncbi:MAG: hypothetical protein D6820_10870 [Lentisphaerae bacterium]|nr:MAG: hypothetical protein D6820_10870 [Lentisphaerota bacterium]
MTALKWFFLTIVRNGNPDFWPVRGGYPGNAWGRRGLGGGGYFAIGLSALPQQDKAAMKWFYNRFFRRYDEKAQTPFDTVLPYPHAAVCAFVN